MNTWVGLTLYLRPKLIASAVVALGAVADGVGFWDMPIPKQLFMQGLLWLILFEFAARVGSAVVEGWGRSLAAMGGVLLSAVLEGLVLYLAYTLTIGIVTVLVNTAADTAVLALLEGVQLFFVCVIGATQLVMGLVHVFGSREAAKAWVSGLKRNWTWMKDLSQDSLQDDFTDDVNPNKQQAS